jgi:hypothetical protein
MIWAGHLEELFKVISRLQRLVLEVALSDSDVFFIGVINLLIVVILIVASSNGNSLGAPLWPPLIAFGASIHAFAGGLGQCPSAIDGGRLPLPSTKKALTASSPESCQVAMSRSSFVVFG